MAAAAAAKTARDLAGEIAFLTRALKAPTLRESVPRLAERARAESWSHEEFLAACLHRRHAPCLQELATGDARAAVPPIAKCATKPGFAANTTLSSCKNMVSVAIATDVTCTLSGNRRFAR